LTPILTPTRVAVRQSEVLTMNFSELDGTSRGTDSEAQIK